jgi:hypothetical protein
VNAKYSQLQIANENSHGRILNVFGRKEVSMNTELNLNENLIAEALEVSGFDSEVDVVTAALEEFIAQHKHLEALELFGPADYDPQSDYESSENNYINSYI